MAAKVLKGETTADKLNFETISEYSLYVNTAQADKLSMTLDEAFVSGAAESFDEITVE